MVIGSELKSAFQNKNVLITGHTGFKGSWLALTMHRLNCNVSGLSLPPQTTPNHFELLNLPTNSFFGDIRNPDTINNCMKQVNPDIVFHLAAQPIVQESYKNPVDTLSTNIMGTTHLLEAIKSSNVKAVIIITSDKCYLPQPNKHYTENHPLGGNDPYSASKACQEIIAHSYRKSFFPIETFRENHQCLIATARAGNVIGGGDWSPFRLLPDICTSFKSKQAAIIRNPDHVRPFQHILDVISGYCLLAKTLLNGQTSAARSWNFGPLDSKPYSVQNVVDIVKKNWPEITIETRPSTTLKPEETNLQLDASQATRQLGWRPQLNFEQTISNTIDWYKTFYYDGRVKSQSEVTEFFGL